MRRTCRLVATIFIVTLFATFSTNAFATSITILNFSFENPDLGASGFNANIDDWTDTGGGTDGVFVAPGFGQGASPTDGDQIAFMNADSGNISQTLGTNFAASTDYALSVDVSARAAPGTDTMTMLLYHINTGNVVKSQILDAGAGVVGDAFNTFTLNVSAAEVQAAGAVGNAIGIHFFGNNAGSGTSDFDLDNVQLESTLVPEPNSLIISVLGLLGLVGIGRRRR